MVPFNMYWLKKDFKVDRMPDDPYADADCVAFTCLLCCAVYQDYAEVKLRMNRRWAERLAEDHPNGDEMKS